jgi:UDP-N-acetylmuramate dehydrogenase
MNDKKIDIKKLLKTGVILAPYTAFKIGGPAHYYIEPRNLREFKEAILWALQENTPYFILGGGSNILIHDSGFNGLVINTKNLNQLKVAGVVVTAECGVIIDTLVDMSLEEELSGVEFAAGLPGTVGGALFMNARAYEGEFSQIVEKVYAIKIAKLSLSDIELIGEELGFSYKQSIFQKQSIYILKVEFTLSRGNRAKIALKIEENRKKRKEMGQYLFPNAGCIFKNDYSIGIPTGKIIEDLGLKGKRIGNAEVYTKHANFIINHGNATAEDVYKLILMIEREVKEKKGINLKREITLIGNWPAGVKDR